jgi:PTH1 family peptidyl-tRNA hydrolase
MDGEAENPVGRRPKLVIGLGNPGSQYLGTRHNVGFELIDRLAERYSVKLGRESRWRAEVGKAPLFLLAKPQTFMNNSGDAVSAIARFYKIPPEEVFVIYDDADFALGRIRIRTSGSAGGHNGIKSIIARLGTDRFPRLKIGIGEAGSSGKMVGHVLGKFTEDERSELEKSFDASIEGVLLAAECGFQAAMNRFNRRPDSPKQSSPQPPFPHEGEAEKSG